MGKRGPKPQPTSLRVVRGNPSNRPLNDREPKPEPDDGTPPETLEGRARDKWLETVPVLQSMGVWSEADRATWERYCIVYDLFCRNREMIEKVGEVMVFKPKTKDGNPYMQVSPFATQMYRAADTLLKIEQQYGLTPSSRSQVQIHSRPEDDPFEAYLKRRGG